MSKGLEALKYLDEHNLNWHDNPTKKYVDIIEKELKALKIIKEKEVNTRFLCQLFSNKGLVRYETYEDYLRKDCKEYKNAYLSVSLFPLTQEEFDLLKEELL